MTSKASAPPPICATHEPLQGWVEGHRAGKGRGSRGGIQTHEEIAEVSKTAEGKAVAHRACKMYVRETQGMKSLPNQAHVHVQLPTLFKLLIT